MSWWGSDLGEALGAASRAAYERASDLAGRALDGAVTVVKQTASAVSDGVQHGVAWMGRVYDRGKQMVKKAAKVVWNAAIDVGEQVVRLAQDALMEVALTLATELEPLVRGLHEAYYTISDALDWLLGNDSPTPELECDGGAQGLSDRRADGLLMGADGRVTDDLRVAKGNAVEPAADNECCKAEGLQHPERVIYYVNGVLTDQHTHSTTLQNIANSLCARVVGIYNATENGPMDFLQTGKDRQLIQDAALGLDVSEDGRNPAVDQATATIVAEIKANQAREAAGLPRQPIEVMCHSQGGAITSLALYRARNQMAMEGVADPLRDVRVVSMGSAAPLWPEGIQHTPYIHADDWVPNALGVWGARLFDGPDKDGRFPLPGEPGFDRNVLKPGSNHSVDEVYLKMYEQDRGGGCGKAYAAQKAAAAAAAAAAAGAAAGAAAAAAAAP